MYLKEKNSLGWFVKIINEAKDLIEYFKPWKQHDVGAQALPFLLPH